jgi:hypothetical protein
MMRLTCLDTQRISRSIQPVEQKLTSNSFARGKSKAVQTASVSPVMCPRHGQEKSVFAERMGLTPLSRELYSPSNLRVMYRSVIPIASQPQAPWRLTILCMCAPVGEAVTGVCVPSHARLLKPSTPHQVP